MRPAEIRAALEGAINARAHRRTQGAQTPIANILQNNNINFADFDDELEISEESRRRLDEQNSNWSVDQLREQAEQAREASRAAAEFWRNKLKAMEIARRIINGDNVPQRDYDFLMEHDPDLFKKAVSLRRFDNEEAEDYDALSEDGETTAADYVIGADMLDSISVPTTSTPTLSGGGAPSGY